MASLTDGKEGAWIDRLLLQAALTPPAAWRLGLYQDTVTDAGVGTEFTPTTAPGYSTTAPTIARSATAWTLTGARADNAAALSTPLATGNWPTAVHIALLDAADMWLHQPLVSPVTVASGSSFTLPIGELDFTFAGNLTSERAAALAAWFFTGAAITWPTEYRIRLASTTPTAGAPGTEIVGNGYARGIVAASATAWQRLGSVGSNIQDLTWAAAAADWPDVVGLDVYDELDVRWFYRAFPAVPVRAGHQFHIPAGKLRLTAF